MPTAPAGEDGVRNLQRPSAPPVFIQAGSWCRNRQADWGIGSPGLSVLSATKLLLSPCRIFIMPARRCMSTPSADDPGVIRARDPRAGAGVAVVRDPVRTAGGRDCRRRKGVLPGLDPFPPRRKGVLPGLDPFPPRRKGVFPGFDRIPRRRKGGLQEVKPPAGPPRRDARVTPGGPRHARFRHHPRAFARRREKALPALMM